MVKPFRIIGHRGALGYAPENTMAAFELAVELGVREVETDVQFTKDRKVVLFHDDRLDRTTNGTGLISDYTLEELRQLDAGSWFTPPSGWERDFTGERIITLKELFERFKKEITYHVEIKGFEEGLIPATLAIIEKHNLVDNCFITAIDKRSVLETRRLAPHIRVGWGIGRIFTMETLDEAKQIGVTQVLNRAYMSDPELVKYGQELGLEVRASAVRNRDDMIKAVETGCNGMTINWPDLLINYMKKRQ